MHTAKLKRNAKQKRPIIGIKKFNWFNLLQMYNKEKAEIPSEHDRRFLINKIELSINFKWEAIKRQFAL